MVQSINGEQEHQEGRQLQWGAMCDRTRFVVANLRGANFFEASLCAATASGNRRKGSTGFSYTDQTMRCDASHARLVFVALTAHLVDDFGAEAWWAPMVSYGCDSSGKVKTWGAVDPADPGLSR